MNKLLMILCVISLSGCAGLNLDSPERWVLGNTFYSTKLPAIKVVVNDSFHHSGTINNGGLAVDTTGQSRAGKDTEKYRFIDNNKRITINIQTLNNHRWHMVPPDFSKSPNALMYDTEKMNGINLNTGVMTIKFEGKTLLTKIYGRVAGESVRYKIYYGEFVGAEWQTKSKQMLTTTDRDFLLEFNERANNSFALYAYDGTPSPSSLKSNAKP